MNGRKNSSRKTGPNWEIWKKTIMYVNVGEIHDFKSTSNLKTKKGVSN